jgi:hypothetical protein
MFLVSDAVLTVLPSQAGMPIVRLCPTLVDAAEAGVLT